MAESGQAYCLGRAFEYGSTVKAFVVLNGVAVLNDAFSAAKVRGRANGVLGV